MGGLLLALGLFQSLFHATVVLIEDKASGTQLIQALMAATASPATSRPATRSCVCTRRPR